MEYYNDYDDFSLRGKLSNKGTGRNNKKDNPEEKKCCKQKKKNVVNK